MTIALDPAALGEKARRMIEALGAITAEPGRMTRLYLSPEHKRANELIAGWMREAGMAAHEDALGTVRGRYEGARADAATLLIGSHSDTVVNAGLFDGNLGIICGILAVGELARAGVRTHHALEVLAFGEEEGVRFPTTYATSRGLVGSFDPAWLGKPGVDGVTLAGALAAFGKDPADYASAKFKGEAAAYVELHIEQGPVLEIEREALGVVTAISGQSRIMVTVTGEAGHAGTVPMTLRRDAFAACAEMTLAVERIANAYPRMVGTVGKVAVSPGAVNVVPGAVTFSVDLRSPSDEDRLQALDELRAAFRAIAEARDVALVLDPYQNMTTTPCAPFLQQGLAAAIRAVGGRGIDLPSGAGHDGQAMAALCPIGMIFVRCRRGISHNPAEYCAPEDMGLAVAALIRFIEGFDRLPRT